MVQSINKYMETISSSINVSYHSDTDTICAFWYDSKNWGDALNPVLIRQLSGRKPIRVTEKTLNLRKRPIYAVIGSILDFISYKIIKNTVIWGPGFISVSGRLSGVPGQICAVRGPLTRDKIKKQGIACPDIYGDPALLYPRFYRPEKTSRYRLGIIPHYVDKGNNILNKFQNYPDVKIIDIEGPINDVIDQICNCKQIASSSLHGVIAADAYGVSSTWVKLSDNIIGNDFKFRDYLESVSRRDEETLVMNDKTTVDDICDTFHNYKISVDLNALLDACPFVESK